MAKPMADGVTSWRGFHITQRRLAMRDVKALPTIIERGVALGVVGSAHREAFKDALIRIHTHSLPLNLDVLAKCSDAPFVHDIRGIAQNYDARHRLLADRFRPFAALPDDAVREMNLETAR